MKFNNFLLDPKFDHSISDQQVFLTPFSEKFISQKYIDWLNDRELMRFSRQRFVDHNYQSCRDFLCTFTNSSNFFWAIIVNNKDFDHIGNITAIIDESNSVANLAIMIGDINFRGKGFGINAWNLALNFLLYKRNLNKVTAGTMAINLPMIKIMKKSNMFHESSLHNFFQVNGIGVDCLIFSKFKEL